MTYVNDVTEAHLRNLQRKREIIDDRIFLLIERWLIWLSTIPSQRTTPADYAYFLTLLLAD